MMIKGKIVNNSTRIQSEVIQDVSKYYTQLFNSDGYKESDF